MQANRRTAAIFRGKPDTTKFFTINFYPMHVEYDKQRINLFSNTNYYPMYILRNKLNERHISHLSTDEMNYPMGVLKHFAEDYPLLSVKELFSTMTDICAVHEEYNAKTKKISQPLFDLAHDFTKLIEAVYLVTRTNPPQPETMIVANLTKKAIRKLRICRRHGCKVINDIPYLILSGHWLYEAGFHIGDEVNVAVEPGILVITINREWDRKNQVWRHRA